MKILITINHLYRYGGSEQFTYELCRLLKKHGHDIYLFCPIIGPFAQEFNKIDIEISNNLDAWSNENFDIIHAQHNLTAILARSYFPDTKMIFMSHGILPDLEQPPSIGIGISHYLAVSEEVRNNLIEKYNIDQDRITILRNIIDTDKFSSQKSINAELKNILVISNHYTEDIENVIKTACNKEGIKLFHIGYPQNEVQNVMECINDSDLVISLGRGIIEAMSAERNVIVFDIHGGDGFIDEDSYYKIRKNNFSGRYFGKKFTSLDLLFEFKKYNQKLGEKLRKLVIENHSEKNITQLKKIYDKVLSSPQPHSQITKKKLTREISFFYQQIQQIYQSNEDAKSLKIIEEKNKELIEKNKKTDQEIKIIKSSTSWRITKPLRDFKDQSTHINQLTKSTLKERGVGALIGSGFNYIGKKIKKLFTPSRKPTVAKVLFLSQANRASFQYRCLNQVEALHQADIQADAFRIDEFNLTNLSHYDIIIFHRVILTEAIELFIHQQPEKTYIYDSDDLIFAQSHLTLLPGIEHKSAESKHILLKELINKEKLVRLCDYAFGTTPMIVAEFEKLGIKTFLVPNVIGTKTIEIFPDDPTVHTGVNLGFVSGSRTHDDNVNLIGPVLAQLFDKYETLQLKIIGPIQIPPTLEDYQNRIKQIDFVPFAKLPEQMSDIDINLAPLSKNQFNQGKSALKFLEASLLKIPTVASAVGGFKETIDSGKNGYLANSDEDWFVYLSKLIENKQLSRQMGERANEYVVTQCTTSQSALPEIIRQIQFERKNYLIKPPYPKVSVVSILYKKARELPYFFQSIINQTYPGEIEIILVDDCSPDNSLQIARQFESDLPANISLKLIENKTNCGNCYSRNRGLTEATGDIIVIIDADCVINPDFIMEHADSHAYGDGDVLIGYMNLETNGAEPIQVIKKYQADPDQLAADALLQDKLNLNSFVNCVTRNFSISAKFLDQKFQRDKFFDEDLSLSNRPDSGFGWEDVEMGYRVWKNGGVIKFNPRTFSVHISHESNVPEGDKPLKSLKNFRRLHEKHPDLFLEARRWTYETYQKILDWADQNKLDYTNNPDFLWLQNHLQKFLPYPFFIRKDRQLKILTYHWHTAHQYEIYKLGHQFDLLTDTGSFIPQKWNYESRPLPANARLLTRREINIKDYDLAILHFDENVLTPENCAGQIGSDWGTTFRWFHERLKLPKIAICHGTPQFYGQYNLNYEKDNLGQVIESEREKLVNYLGDTKVICNSHQAFHEWNFNNSQVIWHGFDPTEFPLTDYTRDVLSLSQAMKDRPHYRGYKLYGQVIEKLGHRPFDSYQVESPHGHYQKDTNEYARAKFNNYVKNIGQYSIYFNPTLRSPMPRSRGEAMMCGLVTVSADNHDVNMFIKNGINGFYSNDPGELADYIQYLLDNPDKCRQIGLAARLTATDIFNHDRFLYEWNKLVNEVIK